MKTPYAILEISENSGDSDIKKAYLAKVRQYPPERYPERFQQVREAYDLIKTEEDRLSYNLFYSSMPEPVDIASIILQKKTVQTAPTGTELKRILANDLHEFCASLDNIFIPNQ